MRKIKSLPTKKVRTELHKERISIAKTKFSFTKEFLFNEYIKNNKTCNFIAKEQGCCSEVIRKYLVKYDIPRRKHNDYPSYWKGKPNLNTLKRNLENNPMKRKEIVEKQRITQSEIYKNPEKRERLIKQALENAKNNTGKTYEEIMGSKERAEERRNKFVGDKNPAKKEESRINISKGLKNKPKSSEHIEKMRIINQRTFEDKFGKERADKIKENMSIKNSLEGNPNWQGGLSFEPYTKEFNDKFKREIRKRDNYICLKCGIHQEKLSKSLTVHHIDYIKENTFNENCCALCVRCNFEVNYNRKHWTKFFQSLLSEKYGYNYSENGEIIITLQNEN